MSDVKHVRRWGANWHMETMYEMHSGPYVRSADFNIERRERKAAQSQLAALREELASANEKIDQAWNRSHAIDHKGFIPGALDAWKRPVPQHLPYDFSGNPGASATQYCNGWNDCGGYWSGHAADLQQRLADAERRNSDCAAKLELAASMMDDDERGNRFAEVCRLAIAALNPNPEAASHDE